jgi:small-conductance mechanosensitive channel
MSNTPPPPPPLKSSLRGAGPGGGFVATSGGQVGPPWIPFSFTCLVFLATLVLFIVGGMILNGVGFLVGSFLGPAALAWFSVEYNKRLSSRRLIERLESRRVVRIMTLAAWVLGSVNIFYYAIEFTSRLEL